LLQVFQGHHRHHLHLRVQSEEKASPLAALWEKVRRLWLQFFRNLLKDLFDLSAADCVVPGTTGNVNLIIMSYDFGAQRVATFTALLGSCSCGIVIVKLWVNRTIPMACSYKPAHPYPLNDIEFQAELLTIGVERGRMAIGANST
jgi:hypothetical protein